MSWALYMSQCAPCFCASGDYEAHAGLRLADAHAWDEWTRLAAGMSHALQWRLNTGAAGAPLREVSQCH